MTEGGREGRLESEGETEGWRVGSIGKTGGGRGKGGGTEGIQL